MATPAEIRQAVDDRLATLWTAVQNRQDTYAASHGGRFWQGLRTHALRPADGTESACDIGTATPTDQTNAPWPLAIRSASLPMAIVVDCYEAPSGLGYVAIVEVTIAGNTWRRAAQVGPETFRQHGWRQVESGS